MSGQDTSPSVATRDLGLLPTFLLGVVALLALTYGREAIDAFNPLQFGEGRLVSDLRADPQARPVAPCRADACTVETVAPAPAAPQAVESRWVAPPLLRRPWPRNVKFPNSLPAWSVSEWIAVPESNDVGPEARTWVLRLGSNVGGLHYGMVGVPDNGYMSRLHFAEPQPMVLTIEAHGAAGPEREAANSRQGERLRQWRRQGNGLDRHGKPDFSAKVPAELLEPEPLPTTGSPEGLEFQRVPSRMAIRLPDDAAGLVSTGDPVAIRFDTPSGFGASYDVPGRVGAVDGGIAQVDVAEENRWWLRDYFAKTLGRAPATDKVTLMVQRSLGVAAGAAVLVPRTALRDATPQGRFDDGEAAVWVLVDTIAVPVHVRVGGLENGLVLVNAVPDAFTGAIRPADWAAMSLEQRAIVRRWLARPDAGRPETLLGPGAKIVAHPGATLRTGESARSL